MKLRTKIVLLSVLIFGFIFTAAGAGIYFVYQESLLSRAEDELESKAELIADNENAGVFAEDPEDWLEQFEEDDWHLWIFNEEDELTAAAGEAEEVEYGRLEELAANGDVIFGVYGMDEMDGATLVVAFSLEEVQEELQLLRTILGAALLAVIALAAAGGAFLAHTTLKPVGRLIRTMERNERQNTFERIPVTDGSEDELHRMTVTFNNMMSKMEANYDRQKTFVSDASHELKTPLTVIESYARLLDRWGGEDAAVREEAVGSIRSETARMKKMIYSLLDLASAESSVPVNEPVDLAKAGREVVKEMEAAYGRTISADFPEEPVIVEGDADGLWELFVILLDNAHKYSDSAVEITVKTERKSAVLEVADKGIGIPAEEQQLVFERFYRVDKSRQRQTGGSGLGLAIAKTIVQQHGGEISLSSRENEGTTVTVRLPLKF